MNITSEKIDEAIEYSVKTIHHICENIGPRESGTAKEREAQEFLKSEIDSNGWADESTLEHFMVARHALVGFTKIVGVVMIVSALLQLLWLVSPLAGKIASGIGLAGCVFTFMTVVLEFVFYRQFLDRFMENTESTNLYAKYKPTGEVKRRIVFNGHVDSAYEWTLMKIKQNVMVGCLVFDVILLFVMIGLAIACFVNPQLWMYVTMACFSVPFITLFFVCNFKVVVPGANDNLTGVLNAVSVLKCLKESGVRLENTEVCCLATGSEEAGLRGAMDWTKKHKEELDQVPTAVIAFDTLRDMDFLTIYDRDMTNLVKNDKDCSRLLDKATEKINHPLKHGGVPFGASDAAAFSRGGLKAVCVAGQDPLHANYYHNTRDTADNLRPETMRVCLELSLAAIEIFDKEGFGD